MSRRGGFTLIELVVIILILGILAGVAAPKMFKTSANATDNGLKQTLSIIRDAIELYTAENGGAFPPCAVGGANFKTALAKYIRGPFPKCPVGPAQNDTILPATGATITGAASPTDGWKYSTDFGVFICNYAAASASNAAVQYDAF